MPGEVIQVLMVWHPASPLMANQEGEKRRTSTRKLSRRRAMLDDADFSSQAAQAHWKQDHYIMSSPQTSILTRLGQ